MLCASPYSEEKGVRDESSVHQYTDANELQKKQNAPYQYHGMTIQEVPITGNLVRVDVYRRAKEMLEKRGSSVHRRSQ
jgi:hypothetical protein